MLPRDEENNTVDPVEDLDDFLGEQTPTSVIATDDPRREAAIAQALAM